VNRILQLAVFLLFATAVSCTSSSELSNPSDTHDAAGAHEASDAADAESDARGAGEDGSRTDAYADSREPDDAGDGPGAEGSTEASPPRPEDSGFADGNNEAGSPDAAPRLARSFVSRTPVVTTDLSSLASDGVTVVAAGGGGLIHSLDGVSWQAPVPTVPASHASFGGGVFVAVGSSGISASSDGRAWMPDTLPAGVPAAWDSVAYFANQFFAVSQQLNGAYLTSADGRAWNEVNVNPVAVHDVWSFVIQVGAAGNLIFASEATVAAGGNFGSLDGVSWSAISSWKGITNDLAFDGRIYCAVGVTGQIYRSLDAQAWTARTLDASVTFGGVTNVDGIFFVVGTGGTMLASKDCDSWKPGSDPPQPTLAPNGESFFLNAIRAHQGRLIVLGNKGAILTSP